MEPAVIEKKVRNYPVNKGYDVSEENLAYRGIRKEAKMPNDLKKDIHVFGFVLSPQKTDISLKLGYVYADVETGALLYLITPYTLDKIEEE